MASYATPTAMFALVGADKLARNLGQADRGLLSVAVQKLLDQGSGMIDSAARSAGYETPIDPAAPADGVEKTRLAAVLERMCIAAALAGLRPGLDSFPSPWADMVAEFEEWASGLRRVNGIDPRGNSTYAESFPGLERAS